MDHGDSAYDPALPDATVEKLRRWHQGDPAALEALIQEHLGWLLAEVRRRISPRLRRKVESQDIVQDAMVRLLRYGPRFVPANKGQFRALLARIVLNTILDGRAFHENPKRDMDREQPVPSRTVLILGAAGRALTKPDEAAERDEIGEWLRLGLEFLDPDDRKVIHLRQWEGLEFGDVAERLGLATADAARMRFQRALPRLAQKVQELKAGRLASA